MTRTPLALTATCVLVTLSACGSSKGATVPDNVGAATWTAPLRPLPSPPILPPKDTRPMGLEAHVLINVPDAGIGPFLARRGDVVMAAYVGSSDDGRRVISLPLLPSGEARGEARVVAPIASDATTLVLRPTGGAKPAFVAAWTSLTDQGEALTEVGIRDDGRPSGDPIELARTAEAIVWVGIVPTKVGALVAWAEQSKGGGDADVIVAALGSDGAMRGVPSRVARGVRGWQLVATSDGAGLALASSVARDPHKRAIGWLALDANAHPHGPITAVAVARTTGDVDAAWTSDGALIAWTDLSRADPVPVVARVALDGRVEPPRSVTEEGSGGALVAVAPDAIAWEEPFRRGSPRRRVLLARVAASGSKLALGAPLALDLEGGGDPEVARLDKGLALLAPARVCANAAPNCADAPAIPTLVKLDDSGAELRPAQVEPFRLGAARDPASVGWSLTCDPSSGGCLALAVAGTDPNPGPQSQVFAVDLAPRASAYLPPFPPPPAPGSPLVEAIDTAIPSGPLADLAATRLGAGAMLATLSAGNEETKRDDVSIVLVRPFPEGTAAGPVVAVTRRALPVGGVAIAGTGNADDGAAVAWVGRDAGDPQVHVSRVDATGKVLRDLKVTSVRGDASDVAIAWTGDQWVVAWVDARDGNGEVYATVLDRDARVVGKGQRITSAPGDASDVALLATPAGVRIAWADPRESPQDGFADIYVATLRAKDASRAGDETRVLATAAHSRSPVWALHGDAAALAWIEEAPAGADAAHARSYGAMLAWLDADGHTKKEPVRLPTAGEGFPSTVTLDDAKGALHAVLAREAREALVLDAMDVTGATLQPYPLLTLDGPPSLDVVLGLTGRSLFFNDEGAEPEQKRARRAKLRW